MVRVDELIYNFVPVLPALCLFKFFEEKCMFNCNCRDTRGAYLEIDVVCPNHTLHNKGYSGMNRWAEKPTCESYVRVVAMETEVWRISAGGQGVT